MWAYLGKKAIIALNNGVTFRGRVSWCWSWGYWCLSDVQLLEDGDQQPQEILGRTFVPKCAITFVQVL